MNSRLDELPPIEYVSIGQQTRCDGFKCTNPEINRWFAKDALKRHSGGSVRVKCAVSADALHRPLGFFAVATVAEEVASLPGTYHPFRGGEHFSALQLVWLATDRGFVNRGLGTIMVGRVIRLFAEIGPQIGLPHLIVIPAESDYDRLVRFYGGLGFQLYKSGEAMFLDLPYAVDAVRKAEAQLAALQAADTPGG